MSVLEIICIVIFSSKEIFITIIIIIHSVIIIVVFNVCSSQTTHYLYCLQREFTHTTGRCRQSWDFFSVICLLLFIITPYHHHVIFQTAHLPPDSHSRIPKYRLWQRYLWIRPEDECPDKTSAESKGKTHIHATSIRKSPNQKKKEQKKEVNHRRFPYCPRTPALHPSVPSGPLLCLQRSHQRGEEEEEEKQSGAEEPQYEKLAR